MKVFVVALSALTLAFVSACTSNAVKTYAGNETRIDEIKIVGGSEIDISYVPSQAAILEDDDLLCSGNIINPRILLTTAHCLFHRNIPKLKIRSGSNFHGSNGRVIAAIRAILHPDYTHPEEFYMFDIALLFLVNPAIAPGIPAAIIILWGTDAIFAPGTYGTLSGWGATEEGGEISSVLRRVALPILSRAACASHYGQAFAANNICAGFSKGKKDGCRGDSGAGLVIGTKLAGLYSSGIGCGQPNNPSGYASIPAFRHWIRQESGV